MRRIVRFLSVLLFATAWGCDGGTGPDETAGTRLVILPAADTLGALQDTVRLRAEVRNRSGGIVAGARVAWSSLDPGIATVDSLGTVVSRGPGSARIAAASGALADTARVVVTTGAPARQLNVVEMSATAPPLTTRDTSFWAVRGDGRRLEIHFRDADGDEGEEFLEFEVPSDALLRYPDGRAFVRGDSVLIRVRIDDESRFLFDFQPSGLQFDPERPARLRVRYARARPDYVARVDSLSVWKQETPDSPWLRIASLRLKDLEEVRAEVTGFTAFALALP